MGVPTTQPVTYTHQRKELTEGYLLPYQTLQLPKEPVCFAKSEKVTETRKERRTAAPVSQNLRLLTIN